MSDDDPARRIARSWQALRRNATSTTMRTQLLGRAGFELEQAQLDTLEVLARRPAGWRMSELADALHIDPSTATRAVTRLERAGLAERAPAIEDRRAVVARASPAGARLTRQVRARRAQLMERLLAPFDDGERLQFADHMERFAAALDEVGAALAREQHGDPGRPAG